MKNEYYNPVKAWNDAMNRLSRLNSINIDEDKLIRMKLRNKKTAEKLLNQNPNYFRELAIKSNLKRKQLKESMQ